MVHKLLKQAVCALVLYNLYRRIQRRKTLEKLQQNAIVDGFVEKGFESVYQDCLNNILENREMGMQLCCFHKGRLVVDIAGGRNDSERLWHNSLVMVFSSTKVMESLVIAMLVDRGYLSYDDKLKTLWPELNVSDQITVKDMMKHQAGLLTSPAPLSTFEDPDTAAKFLQEQEPCWNPYEEGSQIPQMTQNLLDDGFQPLNISEACTRRQAYHSISRGFYASEICRRVDPKGRTLSQYFEEEVASRFRKIQKGFGDFYIGCPKSEQHRCASVAGESILSIIARVLSHILLPNWLISLIYNKFDRLYSYEVDIAKKMITMDPITIKAMTSIKDGPKGISSMANSSTYRSVPMPSVTGCGSAKAMAAILSSLASPAKSEVKLLSQKGLLDALKTSETLIDENLARPVTYTSCGMASDRYEFAGAPGWYGWGGAGT